VPITVDTLRAGKHVICEKPSALSLEENERVIKEAEKADRKVAFCSARMRWGYATLAREYINVGALGDIYRIDVRYYRRRGRPGVDIIQDAPWFVSSELAGGGIVMDMGQYFMDMVLDLAGWPEITSVAGDTYRGHHHDLPEEVPFDVEEHCTFLARTAGQLTFSFDLAWIAHSEPLRQVSILGTEGGIRMTRDKPFAFYADKGGPWRWMETTTDWKDSTGGNDHIYQRLIRAIRGEEVSIGTSPKQALALTEMTRMALTSAAEKREVTREQLRE
ncbi:MAG: Gfo/Idh/MocA family oxidoreductase, partial [Candidatus Brocadiia bacterium]